MNLCNLWTRSVSRARRDSCARVILQFTGVAGIITVELVVAPSSSSSSRQWRVEVQVGRRHPFYRTGVLTLILRVRTRSFLAVAVPTIGAGHLVGSFLQIKITPGTDDTINCRKKWERAPKGKTRPRPAWACVRYGPTNETRQKVLISS